MKNKITDADSQNLPACVQEYIKLVIKKMRYRKKVRAEVMAELAAYFEDELRECKDDTEKEQKAQKLIEQFGDAKLLGILLRRAKKRCRPLWRTALVRTFQAVSAFLIIYLIWFSSGRPVITVDYVAELNKLARPTADESLNAAPLYQKASELIESHLKSSDKILEMIMERRYDANSAQKQLMEKWLTDNKQLIDLVVEGTQKPYCWFDYKSKYVNETIDLSRPFRYCAYILRRKALLEVEKGQYDNALSTLLSCYRLGQQLKGDKTLDEQLPGIAVEAVAVLAIRTVLGQYQIDSSKLTKLQNDLEQINANENFAISLEAEKLLSYDRIQKGFTEDSIGGGHLYLPWLIDRMKEPEELRVRNKSLFVSLREAFIKLKGIVMVVFTQPNKKKTLKTTNELYDYYEKLTLKTPLQIQVEKNIIGEKHRQISSNPFLMDLFFPFEKVFEISSRLKTDVEATTTIIALLRYKQDKGQYPQNLDELKQAGYIKEIPIDLFSDKPLVYRKTDSGFILYSVSLNFKDDGGKFVKMWSDEGDAVFWPVQK